MLTKEQIILIVIGLIVVYHVYQKNKAAPKIQTQKEAFCAPFDAVPKNRMPGYPWLPEGINEMKKKEIFVIPLRAQKDINGQNIPLSM
jgi:hypothetical protein